MALVNHTVAGAAATSSAEASTAAAGDGVLTYTATTVPEPLTVSPQDTVELADLIIVGSLPFYGEPIETNQIAVTIPSGQDAGELVLDHTGMQTSINLTGWTAHPDPGQDRILFKPATGHATLTPEQGVSVQLNKLRINRQVGTAPVAVSLTWRKPGDSNWKTDDQFLGIGKFPAGFYLRNLKASSNYIENGESVTLTWERSTNATYTLLYEDKSIEVTNYSTFTVHNITRNTIFYLEGTAQQGTGSATLRLNTYITVNKPDLEVNDLTVNGTVDMLSVITKRMPPNTNAEYDLTAPTDGLMIVRNGSADLVTILFPGDPYLFVGSHDSETIPVARGTSFKISRRDNPGVVNLIWSSFGRGVTMEFPW